MRRTPQPRVCVVDARQSGKRWSFSCRSWRENRQSQDVWQSAAASHLGVVFLIRYAGATFPPVPMLSRSSHLQTASCPVRDIGRAAVHSVPLFGRTAFFWRTPVGPFHLSAVLLTLAATFGFINQKWLKLPSTIALFFEGLALALLVSGVDAITASLGVGTPRCSFWWGWRRRWSSPGRGAGSAGCHAGRAAGPGRPTAQPDARAADAYGA